MPNDLNRVLQSLLTLSLVDSDGPLSIAQTLWLKALSAEPTCKSCHFSIVNASEGFGESFDKFIKEVTRLKVLLPYKKEHKLTNTTAATPSH